MDASASLFRLEANSVRAGEGLTVGLEFPLGAPWLKDVARVELRLQGQVEYRQSGGGPVRWTLPGAKAHRDGPLAGPRLPFTLAVPHGLPPSLEGKDFHVAWELVATVRGASGKLLHQETRPLRLLPGRARQLPVPREPPPLRPRSALARLASRSVVLPLGCFGLLVGAAMVLGFSLEDGFTPAHLVASVVLLGLCTWMIGWVLQLASHESLKVRQCRLVPLAEAYPLGSTARLRLSLELTQELRVTGVQLVLRGQLSCEGRWQGLLVQKVQVAPPGPLAAGLQQVDLELPIPRGFIPSRDQLLRSTCEAILSVAGSAEVRATCVLPISAEVVEAPGAPAAG
jgi:hypothetical protein